MEKCSAIESTGASLVRGSGSFSENAEAHGIYSVQCIGSNGKVKWTETFDNIVVNQGKNYILDQGFGTSPAGNIVRMGLISSATTPVIGDLYATHAGTTEISCYGATRPTPTFNSSSGGSKATTSAVTFNITSTATVAGCMIVMGPTASATTLSTVSDTSATGGVLYSAGNFGAAKSVTSGDTLNVSYTASL